MNNSNLPARVSQRVAEFLAKQSTSMASRARIAFIIDATMSRQPTWDVAIELQAQMFAEAGKLGGLEMELTYFRGPMECSHSPWMADAAAMARLMSKIQCERGHTKIAKALAHVRREHQKQPISAVVFVGDAMEEDHYALCDAAAGLGMPCFLFQEGDDPDASRTFLQMARLTRGAHRKFVPGSARELANYLRAIVAFAVGGVAALADQRTEAARLLLGQMKK
jgi:hypothetical protein